MKLFNIAIAFACILTAAQQAAAVQIHGRSEKETPVSTDEMMVDDSENGWGTVKIQLGSLPVSTPQAAALALKANLTDLGFLTWTNTGKNFQPGHVQYSPITSELYFANTTIVGSNIDPSASSNWACLTCNAEETDPIFSAWDKDYNDLTNQPTIPDISGLQSRVTGNCVGQVMVSINSDGTVVCEEAATGTGSGDIEGVTAGDGLTGGGTTGTVTISADPTYLQRRIATACTGTQKMTGVNQDGTPICADDEIGATGTGDITSVVAGTRLSGGAVSGDATLNLDAATIAEITANTAKNSYPSVDSTKLSGIAEGATANSPDATLLARANHTGTQTANTISDFDIAAAAAALAAMVDDTATTGDTGKTWSADKLQTELDAKQPVGAYLTSYTETDPIFLAHDAYAVTASLISQWSTAYGWGDHSAAGYLTGYTESDPVFLAHPSYGITSQNVTDWSAAFSWGDHSVAGYLVSSDISGLQNRVTGTCAGQVMVGINADGTVSCEDDDTGDVGSGEANVQVDWNVTDPGSDAYILNKPTIPSTPGDIGAQPAGTYLTEETDPVFAAHTANSITGTNVTNWNSAFSWGDHSTAGYLTGYTETDPIFIAHPSYGVTDQNITDWSTAFSWGNHASAGYLTGYTETDPVFVAHDAYSVTALLMSQWSTAYGWGDHSAAGYLTSFTEADPIFTAHDAYSVTATLISQWSEAYGWGDHSLAGYLTGYTETDPVFIAHPSYAITTQNITDWSAAETNVQPDWDETDTGSDAYIANKPTIPTTPADVGAQPAITVSTTAPASTDTGELGAIWAVIPYSQINLITNSDFAADLSSWTTRTNITSAWVDGEAEINVLGTNGATIGNWFHSDVNLDITKAYRVQFYATNTAGTGTLEVSLGFGASYEITASSNGGVKTLYRVTLTEWGVTSSTPYLNFTGDGVASTWLIDDVVVREVIE